jgi:hypothetical protein
MNKTDHSARQKGPVLFRMVLIGIIVLQAQFVGAFGHVWAFERPAVTSTAVISENIFIIECTPINHNVVGVFTDQIDFLGSKDVPANTEIGFLSGKQRECVDEKFWFGETHHWLKLRVTLDYGNIWRTHEQIIGWCCSIISSGNPQNLIGFSEILYPVLDNSNIGSELLFGGLLLCRQGFFEGVVTTMQDQVLNAQAYGGKKHKEQGGVGNPLWSCISSGLLFAIGLYFLYQVVFKSENCLACGIAFMLGAWPTLFISVWLFLVGVLGWHLWPLDNRSARYNETIIASKIGVFGISSCVLSVLHEIIYAAPARSERA